MTMQTLASGEQKLGTVTISAPSTGDVRVSKVTFNGSTLPAGVTLGTYKLKVGSTEIAVLAAANDTAAAGSIGNKAFSSFTNTGDVTIAAGTSKTFDFYGTIGGNIPSGSNSFSVGFVKDAAAADANFQFMSDNADNGFGAGVTTGNSLGLDGLDNSAPLWTISKI